MEKFIESLTDAGKTTRAIDHMMYITYPLFKDKKILIKVLIETQSALTKCINAILQYEYLYKRIRLYKDPKDNFHTFLQKCAPLYEIQPGELEKIKELFILTKKHQQSTMEFVKEDKLVILSDDMKKETIDLEKIKGFLNLLKAVLQKAQQRILRNI
jgi:hypothetical protein